MKRLLVICLLMFLGLTSYGQRYQIKKFAGGGGAFLEGDSATLTSMSHPHRFVADKRGNIYFSDMYHGVIRKIDSVGVITTIAGMFSTDAGPLEDGAPALATRFFPLGLAIDSDDKLYFLSHHQIYKVEDGILHLIAGSGEIGYSPDGTIAKEANLQNYTGGLLIDSKGRLLFGDNQQLRTIDEDGLIRTVVGNGEYGYDWERVAAMDAKLQWISDIVEGPRGNIYIAVKGGQASHIRKLDTSGFVTVIDDPELNPNSIWPSIGSSQRSLAIAIDSMGVLYYERVSAIRAIDRSKNFSDFAGDVNNPGLSPDGTAFERFRFNSITGLFFGPDGTLFVADEGNKRIFRINYLGEEQDVVLSSENLFSSIDVFPNPFNSRIKINLDKPGNYEIQLINVLGKSKLKENVFTSTGLITLTSEEVPVGAYLLIITDDSGQKHTHRMIKSN